MATAGDLYNLQKIDTMSAKVKRRLLQIQKQLGESDEVIAARTKATETEEQLHHWHAVQLDAELQSQTLKKRIKETEDRMMSGSVSNPKELENLQNSLDALRRQQSGVDDNAVEAMMMVDELTTALAAAKAEFESIGAAWRSGQGDLTNEETKMKRNYVILRKQRQVAAGRMDEDSLQEYEHLRTRKAGVAVAPVENGSCGACHIQLPTGVVSAARSENNTRIFCPSCGRLLYSG